MDTTSLGPACFGLVIGWVTYRTLRRRTGEVAIGDIAAVIGAVGGATIIAIFKDTAFEAYCIGLALGFFLYLIVGSILDKGRTAGASGSAGSGSWMGD